jgi:hypothetical protein
MKQEPKTIYDFSPGDIVTRIQPALIISNSLFAGGMNYDASYVGEKLVFIGIANGCAYFEATDSFTYLLEKGRLIDLPLHKFEEGWAHYIDPVTLINGKMRTKYQSMSDTELVQKLDAAIDAEDYEEASRIKHEIDKREL